MPVRRGPDGKYRCRGKVIADEEVYGLLGKYAMLPEDFSVCGTAPKGQSVEKRGIIENELLHGINERGLDALRKR